MSEQAIFPEIIVAVDGFCADLFTSSLRLPSELCYIRFVPIEGSSEAQCSLTQVSSSLCIEHMDTGKQHHILQPVILKDLILHILSLCSLEANKYKNNGIYQLDYDSRTLLRDGEIYRLTELEADIIAGCIDPVSIEQLTEQCWGHTDEYSIQSLRSALSRLRQKIDDSEFLLSDAAGFITF